MDTSAALHPIDDHTRQFTDTALRIVFHDGLHMIQTFLAITLVQVGHTLNKDELITVLTMWETTGRDRRITMHRHEITLLESLIGGGVQRVFQVFTIAGILHVIGIAEQYGPLTLGILTLQ